MTDVVRCGIPPCHPLIHSNKNTQQTRSVGLFRRVGDEQASSVVDVLSETLELLKIVFSSIGENDQPFSPCCVDQ
jgi:hypothetical protein